MHVICQHAWSALLKIILLWHLSNGFPQSYVIMPRGRLRVTKQKNMSNSVLISGQVVLRNLSSGLLRRVFAVES